MTKVKVSTLKQSPYGFAGEGKGLIRLDKAFRRRSKKVDSARRSWIRTTKTTLVVLIPFLRELITDKAETIPAETLATVVPSQSQSRFTTPVDRRGLQRQTLASTAGAAIIGNGKIKDTGKTAGKK